MMDAPRAKMDLHAFDKALKRAYPGAGLVWKMEVQKRGSIHFHLLVFGLRFLPWQWVAETWGRLVAPGDDEQLKAGTNVQLAETRGAVRSYLEKYVAKVDDGPELENPGRWWGVRRLEAYQAPAVDVSITAGQAATVARLLDRLHRARIMERYQEARRAGTAQRKGWMVRWARRRRAMVGVFFGARVCAQTLRWRQGLDAEGVGQVLDWAIRNVTQSGGHTVSV